jgi:hypothetical protein
VTELCVRLERPGAATDLFLQPAPGEAELAATKHLVEQTLAGVPEEDMPPPPTKLPDAPVPAPAGGAVASAPAAGAKGPAAAASAAKAAAPVPAAAAVAPAGGAAGGASKGSQPQQAQQGGAGSQQGGGGGAAALDWRAPATWSRLAALLDMECGFDGQDPGLGAWLAELLATRRGKRRLS